MATNIVTSDGKDLDSRYLGISAKAASAKTADSVSYSNVSGKPSGNYLIHTCIVVCTYYILYFKLSVVASLGSAIFKYHHGGNGLKALGIGYIKAFYLYSHT